jgi:FkbM family methyltransferase
MIEFKKQKIPNWLNKEVNEYFIDLENIDIVPNTILDIGANIGVFSMRCLERWKNSIVTCIEPMPFNVAQLRCNIGNRANIISAAVREENGIDEIYVGDNFATGGFFQTGRQTQNKLLVECIAAKDLPSSDLVKIDTEGCEVEIITNLNFKNTKIILLEYHSQSDFQKILKFLSFSYKCISKKTNENIGIAAFIKNKKSVSINYQ